MPARRDKILHNGELREAELVDVMESREPWTELTLADGSTLKSKMVIGEVWRVLNEFTAEGDPVYVLKAQVVSMTVAPAHLRKPTK